ncbi:hypothetical protein EDC94DRAFT_610873 [Helicostylum pulchrum]|uniref:Cyclin-like domain-containing protein n=1 Tax=Helicostylum pulchrum TaxID=562976 RepID=A0ABP9Y9I9_9FUNG|nr:hypothetical protein EDC94DRAFT_610873 [Helicostylum pulchrum]
MGTTKRRQSKRNNSRQAALSFLSNITLGNEQEVRTTSTTATETITESPTQYYQNIPTGRSILTRYGTLSVTNDITTKGVSLNSSDSNSTFNEHIPISLTIDTSRGSNSGVTEPISGNSISSPITAEKRRLRRESTSDSFNYHRRLSSSSSASSEVIHQYKLTREDSERPIASEKVKKRSDHQENNIKNSETGTMSFMSVFRYYKGIIRQPRRRSDFYHNHHVHYQSYFHQHLSNMHLKHRKVLSYGHFLSPVVNNSSSSDETSTVIRLSSEKQLVVYNPYYLDDDTTLQTDDVPNSQALGEIKSSTNSNNTRKELNEKFRKNHPELPLEITLSKINTIKTRLLNIGKAMDLEISSVSHAFVYFEKLVQKGIVNKQNRKLVAACCLFLATKVNEPKGSWFKSLLETIHSELNVSPKEVLDYEFAVFADLDFNLYVPLCEFMPHFNRLIRALEIRCIEEYLGEEPFYKIGDGGYEIVGTATSSALASSV